MDGEPLLIHPIYTHTVQNSQHNAVYITEIVLQERIGFEISKGRIWEGYLSFVMYEDPYTISIRLENVFV